MARDTEEISLSALNPEPVPLYGKRPFPKSASRCKRCKMPSDLQFCMMCQTEFVTQARMCFQSILDAVEIQRDPRRSYEEKRAAYKSAKRRLKQLQELKTYGVTFEQTKAFRKALRSLREALREEKSERTVSLYN